MGCESINNKQKQYVSAKRWPIDTGELKKFFPFFLLYSYFYKKPCKLVAVAKAVVFYFYFFRACFYMYCNILFY